MGRYEQIWPSYWFSDFNLLQKQKTITLLTHNMNWSHEADGRDRIGSRSCLSHRKTPLTVPEFPTGQETLGISRYFPSSAWEFFFHPSSLLSQDNAFSLWNCIHCKQLWILTQPGVLLAFKRPPGFQIAVAEEGEGPQWVNVTKLFSKGVEN